jgi:Protein of unknown function (DUF1501)
MVISRIGTGEPRSAEGLSRRDFITTVSLGAIGTSVLADVGKAQAQPIEDISCIFILLVGGPSQLDTWDMKPHAAEGIRGPFRPIATRVPGLWISELFPRLARVMDKISIVRTLCHPTASVHDSGHQAIQTGREFDCGFAYPHYGSVLAWLKGPRRGLPPYHLLPGPIGRTGGGLCHGQDAGFLGEAFDPVGLDGRRVGSGHAESGTGSSTRGRRPFEIALAADTCREDTQVNDRFGASPFGLSCLRARQLIEAGVRFVTINMFDTVFHSPSWDMHGYSPFSTFSTLREEVGPQFDAGFTALIEDLDERRLLETTMVVAVGEFGRSPQINRNDGRDHHSSCWSGLLAGGKIRGGLTVGRTDDIAFEPAERPVSLPEFAATVYHGLNVPRELMIDGPNVQRQRLIDDAVEPVYELF